MDFENYEKKDLFDEANNSWRQFNEITDIVFVPKSTGMEIEADSEFFRQLLLKEYEYQEMFKDYTLFPHSIWGIVPYNELALINKIENLGIEYKDNALKFIRRFVKAKPGDKLPLKELIIEFNKARFNFMWEYFAKGLSKTASSYKNGMNVFYQTDLQYILPTARIFAIFLSMFYQFIQLPSDPNYLEFTAKKKLAFILSPILPTHVLATISGYQVLPYALLVSKLDELFAKHFEHAELNKGAIEEELKLEFGFGLQDLTEIKEPDLTLMWKPIALSLVLGMIGKTSAKYKASDSHPDLFSHAYDLYNSQRIALSYEGTKIMEKSKKSPILDAKQEENILNSFIENRLSVTAGENSLTSLVLPGYDKIELFQPYHLLVRMGSESDVYKKDVLPLLDSTLFSVSIENFNEKKTKFFKEYQYTTVLMATLYYQWQMIPQHSSKTGSIPINYRSKIAFLDREKWKRIQGGMNYANLMTHVADEMKKAKEKMIADKFPKSNIFLPPYFPTTEGYLKMNVSQALGIFLPKVLGPDFGYDEFTIVNFENAFACWLLKNFGAVTEVTVKTLLTQRIENLNMDADYNKAREIMLELLDPYSYNLARLFSDQLKEKLSKMKESDSKILLRFMKRRTPLTNDIIRKYATDLPPRINQIAKDYMQQLRYLDEIGTMVSDGRVYTLESNLRTCLIEAVSLYMDIGIKFQLATARNVYLKGLEKLLRPVVWVNIEKLSFYAYYDDDDGKLIGDQKRHAFDYYDNTFKNVPKLLVLNSQANIYYIVPYPFMTMGWVINPGYRPSEIDREIISNDLVDKQNPTRAIYEVLLEHASSFSWMLAGNWGLKKHTRLFLKELGEEIRPEYLIQILGITNWTKDEQIKLSGNYQGPFLFNDWYAADQFLNFYDRVRTSSALIANWEFELGELPSVDKIVLFVSKQKRSLQKLFDIECISPYIEPLFYGLDKKREESIKIVVEEEKDPGNWRTFKEKTKTVEVKDNINKMSEESMIGEHLSYKDPINDLASLFKSAIISPINLHPEIVLVRSGFYEILAGNSYEAAKTLQELTNAFGKVKEDIAEMTRSVLMENHHQRKERLDVFKKVINDVFQAYLTSIKDSHFMTTYMINIAKNGTNSDKLMKFFKSRIFIELRYILHKVLGKNRFESFIRLFAEFEKITQTETDKLTLETMLKFNKRQITAKVNSLFDSLANEVITNLPQGSGARRDLEKMIEENHEQLAEEILKDAPQMKNPEYFELYNGDVDEIEQQELILRMWEPILSSNFESLSFQEENTVETEYKKEFVKKYVLQRMISDGIAQNKEFMTDTRIWKIISYGKDMGMTEKETLVQRYKGICKHTLIGSNDKNLWDVLMISDISSALPSVQGIVDFVIICNSFNGLAASFLEEEEKLPPKYSADLYKYMISQDKFSKLWKNDVEDRMKPFRVQPGIYHHLIRLMIFNSYGFWNIFKINLATMLYDALFAVRLSNIETIWDEKNVVRQLLERMLKEDLPRNNKIINGCYQACTITNRAGFSPNYKFKFDEFLSWINVSFFVNNSSLVQQDTSQQAQEEVSNTREKEVQRIIIKGLRAMLNRFLGLRPEYHDIMFMALMVTKVHYFDKVLVSNFYFDYLIHLKPLIHHDDATREYMLPLIMKPDFDDYEKMIEFFISDEKLL